MEFYLTTNTGLSMSSGSLNFASVTDLVAYEIDCTVTWTPSQLQGAASNFSVTFTNPSILLDGAILYLEVPLN